MTTAEPDAGPQKRGRHAKRDDADDRPGERQDDEGQDDEESRKKAPAVEGPPETVRGEQPRTRKSAVEQPAEPATIRSRHAIAHHPAGASLLTAAGLLTGLALAPLLFDRLRFEVATRAADAARSAAAPWPGGGQPWFWPGWVATTAALVGLAVLVLAAVGLKAPDLVVLATAVVLTAATARAAWATFDVLDARLWALIPVCIVCVVAFGSAAAAAFRWRSPDSDDAGIGTGEVAGVTIGAWLLVVLLLLGGSAIASSAQTHADAFVTSPPQDLAGLLSVRAADAPELDDLRGSWVPQVAAAQVTDDAAASAYAVRHHDWTARFPTVLTRGDDVGAPGLDDTWWLSLVAQPYGSGAEAAAWCAANGLAERDCSPRLVSG
ncbi:MAG TPA: hypothetical protein VGD09_02690 [Blastococcus sp.]